VSEQAQVAGWAAFDAGMQTKAKKHYKDSLKAAKDAKDAALTGNALAFLAYQEVSTTGPNTQARDKALYMTSGVYSPGAGNRLGPTFGSYQWGSAQAPGLQNFRRWFAVAGPSTGLVFLIHCLFQPIEVGLGSVDYFHCGNFWIVPRMLGQQVPAQVEIAM
jgi:hypothetical protein